MSEQLISDKISDRIGLLNSLLPLPVRVVNMHQAKLTAILELGEPKATLTYDELTTANLDSILTLVLNAA